MKKHSDCKLYIISAPAGGGKDTILELAITKTNFEYSVSATTRPPRKGEVNGVHYFFVSDKEFERLIQNGGLIEYTKYADNYYGTPKDAVTNALEQGKNVVLKIETEGAVNVKRIFPESVSIFIKPPSMEVLEQRLRKRGTETEEQLKKRLKRAEEEIEFSKYYDYVIVNDKLDTAVNQFVNIINNGNY